MFNFEHSKKLLFLVAVSLAVCATTSIYAQSVSTNDVKAFSPYVDGTGNIKLPDDFRRTMVHLGTWFVPEGDASGFHDTYADQNAVDVYRETGKWPDGATLVKELRHSVSGNYTTGKGVSHAGKDIKQWFVMVKDTQGRFSKNPSWGDGWGWALIKTGDTAKNVSTNYKTDCLGCHIPAQSTDWIYVEGMPTLSPLK